MTFPALVPSVRTYVPGNVPQVQQIALSGSTVAYRQGNRRVGQTLQLSFNNISEADLNLIRSHYVSQDGSYGIFFLSPEIWSGYATAPVPSPSNVAWRYATPPVITDGSCDLWSVAVELTSYLIEEGDISIDNPDGNNGSDPALPGTVAYIYDGLTSAAAPARAYLIDSGASA